MLDVGTIPEDTNQALVYLVGVLVVALCGMFALVVRTWVSTNKTAKAMDNAGPVVDDIRKLTEGLARVEHRQGNVMNWMTSQDAKQSEFDLKGWPSLPEDLNTAAGLTEVVRELQHTNKEQTDKIDKLTATLTEHDRWERARAYVEQ